MHPTTWAVHLPMKMAHPIIMGLSKSNKIHEFFPTIQPISLSATNPLSLFEKPMNPKSIPAKPSSSSQNLGNPSKHKPLRIQPHRIPASSATQPLSDLYKLESLQLGTQTLISVLLSKPSSYRTQVPFHPSKSEIRWQRKTETLFGPANKRYYDYSILVGSSLKKINK